MWFCASYTAPTFVRQSKFDQIKFLKSIDMLPFPSFSTLTSPQDIEKFSRENARCSGFNVPLSYSISKITAGGVLLVCLWASTLSFTRAQAPVGPPSIFEYLSPAEGAEFRLEFDLTGLVNQKKTNSWFPATLTTSDGALIALEIRPRGKFRRMTCDVPPLKLKFSKKSLRAFRLDTLKRPEKRNPFVEGIFSL
jgi:hypothetical protein